MTGLTCSWPGNGSSPGEGRLKDRLTPGSGVNVIKLFTTVLYKFLQYALVFVPDRPSLVFGRSEAIYSLGPIHQHSTRLERPPRYKNYSSLRKIVNFGRKTFCKFGTWANVINLSPRNLLIS
jgi:hypothetical protein